MRRSIWLSLGLLAFLVIGIAATWEDPALRNKMVTIFRGATSTVAGTPGVVPRPAAGDQAKYLRADATWAAVTAGSTGVESPLALDTSTSITGILPTAKGGTGGAKFGTSTADARILQLAAGDTFTAGLGATGQVTLSAPYSGNDITFLTDTDGAANSGTTLLLKRDVTNGANTGNWIKAIIANGDAQWRVGYGTSELVPKFEIGKLATTNASGGLAYGTSAATGLDYPTALGVACTASGRYGATAIGNTCVASANYSFSCGSVNTASGDASFASGSNNIASGKMASAFGQYGKATKQAQWSHASYAFGDGGDQQTSIYDMAEDTADATPVVLTMGNNAAYRITLVATTTYQFTVKIAAYNTTDNLSAGYNIRGCIATNATANTTRIIGTNVTEAWEEGAMSACDAAVTADTTNTAMTITVTGIAGKNMRWHATVITSEVSYGTP